MNDEEERPHRKTRKGKRRKRPSEDDGHLEFKRPRAIDEDSSYNDRFMAKTTKKKKGESCPVCGTEMSFKEKVNCWYCSKCKNFF